jgi:molecular chaperone GrpE (heat shock protein)
MSEERTPFDSIEGSLEYIVLLRQAIETARAAVAMEKRRAQAEDARRRIEALQLVAYKLERLASHTDSSRRLLNDLRTLRRLLLNEREEAAERRTDLAHP